MFDDEKDLSKQENDGTTGDSSNDKANEDIDIVIEETTDSTDMDIQNNSEYVGEENVNSGVQQPEYAYSQEDIQTEQQQNDVPPLGYETNNGGSYYNTPIRNNQDTSENGGSYYDYYSSNQNYNKNNKSDKNNKVIIISVLAVVVIIFVGGIAVITNNIINNANKAFDGVEESITKEDKEAEYPTIGSTVTDKENNSITSTDGVIITDVSNVVEDVMPSIVSITSTTIVESNDYGSLWPFYGGYGEGEQEYEEQLGAGSGIVVKQTDTELLIVTNNHVVSGADSLSIQFVNGTSINGVTKSTDEAADIAIVSIKLADIDSDTMKSIKLATLGSSDDIKVGEGVVAIGNALGYGQSVTTGVISAKEREISVDNQTMVVLQTDAAINGGNSGGALLNSQGEVIGINVAKYSSSSYSGSASVEGMGFAIPISQATDIINTLMSKETREKVSEEEKGVLGIVGVAVDSSAIEIYSLPQGIYIREVVEGGAAEKAGLRATDVITKFDSQTVSTMESLQEKLGYYKAGEKVTLTIMRNTDGGYKEVEVDVTLSPAEILDDVE